MGLKYRHYFAQIGRSRFECKGAWMPIFTVRKIVMVFEGTRRANYRGGLSFGSFSLAVQRK
jgi:hypothetical protein